MIKRTIVAFTAVCFVICAIVTECFAYSVYDSGVKRVYNGSYWTEQAWVEFKADNYHDYYLTVYVKRNGVRYGNKRTTVLAGKGDKYYSYASQGSGGTAGRTVQVK
jgi:hypothetical protein